MEKITAHPSFYDDDEGVFEWKRRMGIHLAYHTSKYNNLAHIFTTPFQLMGIIVVISGIYPDSMEYEFASVFTTFAIFFLGLCVYVRTDTVCGWTFTIYLQLLQIPTFPAMGYLGVIGYWRILFGLVGFVGFNVLERIAHKFLEPDGRDDLEVLWPEFFKTLNVVPLLLPYYFNCVEIFFVFGYKPELRKAVLHYKDKYQFPNV